MIKTNSFIWNNTLQQQLSGIYKEMKRVLSACLMVADRLPPPDDKSSPAGLLRRCCQASCKQMITQFSPRFSHLKATNPYHCRNLQWEKWLLWSSGPTAKRGAWRNKNLPNTAVPTFHRRSHDASTLIFTGNSASELAFRPKKMESGFTGSRASKWHGAWTDPKFAKATTNKESSSQTKCYTITQMNLTNSIWQSPKRHLDFLVYLLSSHPFPGTSFLSPGFRW